ncbi:hypothetical protein CO038_04400 [Candidatus Pacearchaeota archaeon CG_4_9_14_0_2_um_filter_39_13]|nr:hypothetical protein [Candidatus Pacearchaeota archaeon]PJC44309.1 MAG: hypothetical protein CO038_04400 [Candidatus Pacearchaeota archaeon CG_4_9_14_0_2_um_filter_39_13]
MTVDLKISPEQEERMMKYVRDNCQYPNRTEEAISARLIRHITGIPSAVEFKGSNIGFRGIGSADNQRLSVYHNSDEGYELIPLDELVKRSLQSAGVSLTGEGSLRTGSTWYAGTAIDLSFYVGLTENPEGR